MKRLKRRQFLRMVGGLAAGAALTGCGPSFWPDLEPEFGPWPAPTAGSGWRLLNRVTFGPRPQERQRLNDIGPAAFLEEQLAPDLLPEMAIKPRLKLRRLETLRLAAPDLFDVERDLVMTDLQQASLLRAIYSPRQLYEVMVDFWTDHFSIDQNKGDCAWLKTVDDRKVIRPHALGNFFDLLHASAHSPAMLYYLDNQENHVGNPNENYARELMELHTVGVNGGYSQLDVQELARCLTGWTIKNHFHRGRFTFNPDQHDDRPKVIMGLQIRAGAQQNGGEQVIEMLATHPATARFIATKLVRRFVADDPPAQLVASAARKFEETRGDIRAVLRTILLSPELLTPRTTTGTAGHDLPKLKRPLEFVVSALRQLNAQTDAGAPILTYLTELGQPLFQWPTPDGFPDRVEAWNRSLLTRWRYALALVHNSLTGTSLDLGALLAASNARTETEHLDELAGLLLGTPLPQAIRAQLLQSHANDEIWAAALLGSPAFQWK
jgi:uncharacterized protein (DUF1800 family)